MVQSESPTEPVIESFRRVLTNWDNLWKPGFGLSQLKVFVSVVRSLLKKIYGTDAPQLLAFSGTIGVGANVQEEFARLMAHAKRMVDSLEAMPTATATPLLGKRIFIGHGRSHLWRELKDFIAERLYLPWDEFNRESVAGITTSERLQNMLFASGFAFLIMTAEDERPGGTVHARDNVIHEVGLFQGRLGPRRAIVLLEEGCSDFSNIHGLGQIRFPHGDISARFEKVRHVLEAEGLL